MDTTMRNDTMSLIVSIFLYLFWFLFYSMLLPRRYRLSTTLILELIGLLVYYSVSTLPPFGMGRVIGGMLLIVVLEMLLYMGGWLKRLLIAVTPLVLMLICEFATVVAVPLVTEDRGLPFQITVYALYLFLNMSVLGSFVLAIRAIRRKRSGDATTRVSGFFVLFPISQFVAIAGWYTPLSVGMRNGRPTLFLLALALFAAADIALIAAFNASARSTEFRLRAEMLEQQAASQKEQYAALAEHYDEMRRLRHDIDNHLYTIRSLLADGKLSDASQYAGELSGSFSALSPGLELCENTVAASYLLHKKKELEARSIRLSCSAALPPGLHLPAPDLICVLGNLLDNAEEACAGIKGAEIALTAAFSEPYLNIRVENPCRSQQTDKRRRIPELSRGVGTEILQRYADKYDGSYVGEEAGGRFRAALVLRL